MLWDRARGPVGPHIWMSVGYPGFIVFLVVALLSAGALSCGDSSVAGTAEQRDLGDVTLNPQLTFSLQYGTIDDQTNNSVRARASIPLPQFNFVTGPGEPQRASLRLANIHREATLQVLEYTPLDASMLADCPTDADTEPVVCSSARREGEEPTVCQAPEARREPAQQSVLNADFELPACTHISFGLKLNSGPLDDADPSQPSAQSDETNAFDTSDHPARLHFKVIGSAESLAQLQLALIHAAQSEPDFIILLGDVAENTSLNGLRELDFMLRQADLPAVVLPGEGEVKDDARARFLSTFGPFDLRWNVGTSQFYAFYSADGDLSQRGVSRIKRELDRLDSTRPAFVLTHTPPFDPVGPRDQGFRSALEAARTMSIIAEAGVDALFAGHINAYSSSEINGVPLYLTSLRGDEAYLTVEIIGDEISISRQSL